MRFGQKGVRPILVRKRETWNNRRYDELGSASGGAILCSRRALVLILYYNGAVVFQQNSTC